MPCPLLSPDATSVSQIAVSTASIWQKNGRTPPNAWWRQCWRSRRVSGVTCQWSGLGSLRHSSTRFRNWLMIDVGSYCWACVERPAPSSRTRLRFFTALCFRGLGIGVMSWTVRRRSMIFCVGWPDSSSSQCLEGYAYGELSTGCSKNWRLASVGMALSSGIRSLGGGDRTREPANVDRWASSRPARRVSRQVRSLRHGRASSRHRFGGNGNRAKLARNVADS